MRQLTLHEVNEEHGGKLPPDAMLRADDESDRPTLPAKPKRLTRSERFAVLNAFADCSLADLTGAETKVWLILFRDTKRTGTARTGQADIAHRAGISGRAVKLAVRSLKAKGFLQVVHRGRMNVGPSVYRIHPTGPHGEA